MMPLNYPYGPLNHGTTSTSPFHGLCSARNQVHHTTLTTPPELHLYYILVPDSLDMSYCSSTEITVSMGGK